MLEGCYITGEFECREVMLDRLLEIRQTCKAEGEKQREKSRGKKAEGEKMGDAKRASWMVSGQPGSGST